MTTGGEDVAIDNIHIYCLDDATKLPAPANAACPSCVDANPPMFTTACPADITIACNDPVPPTPVMIATDDCNLQASAIWVNEIHYDNDGTDVGEFVEIAGAAGFDLTGYEIFYYNGPFVDATTTPLSGIIPNEGNGFGAIAFFVPGLMDGPSDGLALVDPAGNVLYFLSYEGTLTAANGPAAGLQSTNIGTEPSDTPIGQSLQVFGITTLSSFTWQGPLPESPGLLNAGQSLSIFTTDPVEIIPVIDLGNAVCGVTGGSVTRTWTAIDGVGNTTVCTQVITIEQDLGPELICPANMIINLDPGECNAIVNWIDPIATDDCGVPPPAVNQTGGPLSGSTFERNTTTTITYETDPDLCGRTAICSFDITIIEFQNPISSIACNNAVNISLHENCTATVGADQVLEGGPYGCYDDYIVSIEGGGNVIGAGMVGQTLQYTVTDPNGNSCWGTITVEDKIEPMFLCDEGSTVPITVPVPFEPEGGTS